MVVSVSEYASLEISAADVTASAQSDKLLDNYTGAAAAYAVRKLRANYTGPCIEVRRGDGQLQDIGFDANGNLDTAAIKTFCDDDTGGTPTAGTVRTWYDQSGNGNNLTQNTAANQAKIYNGSAVLTRNGKPCIQPNDGGDFYDASGLTLSSGDQYIFAVMAQTIDLALLFQEYNYGGQYYLVGKNGDTNNNFGISSYNLSGSPVPATTPTYRLEGTAQTWATGDRDAVHDALINQQRLVGIEDSSAPAFQGITLGYAPSSVSMHEMQELVIYNSDESANRTGIESDINEYYGIYEPLLLDTYSGAAAAYSVRKLRSDYTGPCLTVRRSQGTAPNTQDIGFDSNGDLDIAAIKSFCDAGGSNTLGYVTTWYDQSSNGEDMTQGTAANQPQIYDGTAVITKNGKPIIVPSDGNDELSSSTLLFNSVTTWQFSCIEGRSGFDILWGSNLSSSSLLVSQSGSSSTGQGGGNLSSQTLYKNGSVWTPSTRDDVYTAVYQTQILFSSVQTHASNWGGSKTTFGYTASPDVRMFGMQEEVIYTSDQSSNRTGIESNINAYFSIYATSTPGSSTTDSAALEVSTFNPTASPESNVTVLTDFATVDLRSFNVAASAVVTPPAVNIDDIIDQVLSKVRPDINFLQDQVSIILQDLLRKVSIDQLSKITNNWNQQFDKAEDKVCDNTSSLNDLQILYSNLQLEIDESISGAVSGILSGDYVTPDQFSGHSGETGIHYEQSEISISTGQIYDFASYVESVQSGTNEKNAELSTAISGVSTTLTSHISDYNNPHKVKPAQIGAATTGDLDTLNLAFNSHTNNSGIHYTQSEISISTGQIFDFGEYTDYSDFSAHSGNTGIHYEMGNIFIGVDQLEASSSSGYVVTTDGTTVSWEPLPETTTSSYSILLASVPNSGLATTVVLQSDGVPLDENEPGIPIESACSTSGAIISWLCDNGPAGFWTLTLKKKAYGSSVYSGVATISVTVS